MNPQSGPVAQLCASCEKELLFQDDQEFLYEAVDGNGHPFLAKSQHTAVTVTRLVVLREDTLPGLPLLADSSKQGCDFCTFLRDIIFAEDTQDEAKRIFGSTFTDKSDECDVSIQIHYRWKNGIERDSRGGGLQGLIIILGFDEETEITLFCLAEGITGSEASDIWLGLNAPPSQRYDEKHRLDWMSKTFHDDLKSQQYQYQNKPFVPERLIYVDDPRPRLVLRTDPGGFGVGSRAPMFAALSYCWGPIDDAKQQLTTTTASLSQRRKAIETVDMTEVLRDAVAVTRALKIPYLWVDALCILQDDISDWEAQCVKVAELYASASVTICAASSTSCRQGFLRQRGLRIRIPFRSVRGPISGSYYLQFKYAGLSRGLVFSDDTADFQHSRWGNRGWVFQENFSASRKLVFGNASLHYYTPSSVQTMGSDTTQKVNGSVLSRNTVQDREWTYKSWASIIREYSRCEGSSFTKTKDILPALSGLTSHYYDLLQEEFYAGLWKGDLFRGLMWYWDGDSVTLPKRDCCLPRSLMRHEDLPIPSWSPLGRGMFVTHGALYKDDECFTSFQPEYQLLRASTTPIGNNPFGEIENNWSLLVHSYVLNLATLDNRKLNVEDSPYDPDSGSRGILAYEGKQVGCFELDFCYDEYADLYPDSMTEFPTRMMDEISHFSWVLLGSCKVRHVEEPEHKMRRARGACGLILIPVPGSDTFCRVGTFSPGFPEHHHDGLALIKRLCEVRSIVVI